MTTLPLERARSSGAVAGGTRSSSRTTPSRRVWVEGASIPRACQVAGVVAAVSNTGSSSCALILAFSSAGASPITARGTVATRAPAPTAVSSSCERSVNDSRSSSRSKAARSRANDGPTSSSAKRPLSIERAIADSTSSESASFVVSASESKRKAPRPANVRSPTSALKLSTSKPEAWPTWPGVVSSSSGPALSTRCTLRAQVSVLPKTRSCASACRRPVGASSFCFFRLSVA